MALTRKVRYSKRAAFREEDLVVRRGLVISATVAAVALTSSGAGASTQASRTADVSTRASAVQYLVSLGLDPSGVVIQRGAHNYAGPSCPGRGWTCTTSSRVLQIAARASDDNQFVCSDPGTSTGPGDCTIIQVSSGADNVARCLEASGDPNATESCRIQQTNTTGANKIQVRQQINGDAGDTQAASQYAGSLQINGSGSNDVQIQQQLQQRSNSTNATGAQSQDGHQNVSVTQTSDSGDNSAHVDQSLHQEAQAKGDTGAAITQRQNTDGQLNTSAAVNQTSTSGKNTAQVNQSNDEQGNVHRAGTALQEQGSPGGGLAMFFNQSSTGLSTVKGEQHEHQHLNADQVGSLTQNQFGPMWSDPTQGSNTGDRYDIGQSSDEHASNPTNQDDAGYGQCFTSGNCTIDQHINVQGDNQQNSCSGTSCDIGLIVGSNSDGSFSDTCGGATNLDVSGCPTPPSPPPIPFPNTIFDSGPPR
jgi:hypothetical protein